MGGVRLRAQKAKVEGLAEQLRGVEKQLSLATAKAEGGEKAVERIEASVEKATQTAKDLEAKIEATKAAFKALEDDAMEVMKKYEACQAELQAKEEALKESQEAFEEKKKAMAKVNLVEVEMQNKLDEYVHKLKENESKAKYWSEELSKLRAKLAAEAEAAEAEAVTGGEGSSSGDEGAAAGEEAGGSSSSSGGAAVAAELSAEELERLDAAELASEIRQLEEMLEGMDSNTDAIKEYREREREYKVKLADFDGVTAARDAKRKEYETLRKQRLDEFMSGFKIIGMKLKEMYQMITLGGDAELELLDSLDPFSEGICFSVRPPKKSWKHIANLSGGEKTPVARARLRAAPLQAHSPLCHGRDRRGARLP